MSLFDYLCKKYTNDMRRIYHTFLTMLMMGVSTLTSCSDSDDADQNVTILDDTMMSLTVIYSPSGPGDNGYNDLMTEGLAYFSNQDSIAMHTIRPTTTQEAEQLVDKWLEDTKDREQRSLLVLAGSEYEQLAAKMTSLNDGNRSVLLVESESANMPEGVSTANIDRKSVFYLAGAMSARCDAYIIAAVRGDKVLDASIKAFKDGFEKHTDQYHVKEVLYISEEENMTDIPEWCYNQPGAMYMMSKNIIRAITDSLSQPVDEDFDPDSYISDSRFILMPLAGASNYGAYTLAMEEDINGHSSMGIIGMDKDYSGQLDLSPFSVTLRVDKMMHNTIAAWVKNEQMPKHHTFTMSEDYADIVLNPTFDRTTNFAEETVMDTIYYLDGILSVVQVSRPIDENYWEDRYSELREEAIEYGEKK